MNQLNNGIREGYWEFFSDNGKLDCKGSYINGEKDGYWKYYFYNTDKIGYVGNYNFGKSTGCWVFYFIDGEVNEKQFYL